MQQRLSLSLCQILGGNAAEDLMRNRVAATGAPASPAERVTSDLASHEDSKRLSGALEPATLQVDESGGSAPVFTDMFAPCREAFAKHDLISWLRSGALWRSPKIARAVVCSLAVLALLVYLWRDVPHEYLSLESIERSVQAEKYTVRLNTYKRNDFLRQSLANLDRCAEIAMIQVIWSDQDEAPPAQLKHLSSRGAGWIEFEVHQQNSINNRFLPKTEIPTEAVLSIDDDLLPTCAQLRAGFLVWRENRETMVGYHPRNIDNDVYSQFDQKAYLNGYHLVLTKIAFFHRKHLRHFQEDRFKQLRDFVDGRTNCEDLAMAFLVSEASCLPPIWVDTGKPKEMWQWYHLTR
eukprot:scaffold2679_cov251-Pinguiococcus_pyrenoidosus.AAC.16